MQQLALVDGPPEVRNRAVSFPLYTVSLVREKNLKADPEILDQPSRAAAVMRSIIGDADREKFVVLLLDARHRLIGANVVSVGTLSASLVHPREAFKPAILAGAAAIILGHNHPSGDCSPSPEDREATARMRKAGELLGLPVLDHVILGEGGSFYSFQNNGGI